MQNISLTYQESSLFTLVYVKPKHDSENYDPCRKAYSRKEVLLHKNKTPFVICGLNIGESRASNVVVLIQ